ncbi:methionyl-tRNA formyltransferase [Kineococcus rhizosphaerae]|uniref:Methionyl-tRNA formyltransferase n=1 Tax=Kineococcus rhizosphaerae TaxID=559628 RepID=A0A2T0R9V2_9ACTN|nr:methionyl-tRNA formyltransferase [Kineococcus rhizosphaerae]PRY17949.1 methionyl-tRNA formyltransferase [Kineococcus rhizosphaerae]
MRLVLAGTPDVAVPALDALLASRHDVVAVLTRPDAVAGRGRKPVASPLAQRAREAGLPVLQPVRPRGEEFLAQLRDLEPDACPVVAYGALVPREALDVPRFGWLNLHFSLLPAWRGAAPVQRAVMHGDDVTGACVFALEEGLDTGPVYARFTEPVGPRDSAGDLLGRLAVTGARTLVDVLDALEDGTAAAVPQTGDVSLAPKITVEEARVDWTRTAAEVDRHVRGCTPEPGSWTTFRGERFKLAPVTPTDEDLPAGRIVVERKRVLVGTGAGSVELGPVQPAGKKLMGATDWARGTRPQPGEEFA